MIVAANDMRDAHQRVVNRDHIVIDRHACRHTARASHQHRIADGFRGKLHIAANNVVEAEWVVFDSQPHCEVLAGSEILFNLTGRQIAATA